MENLEAAIVAVVKGDLNCLPAVLAAEHLELLKAAANLPQLSVSRTALTQVLQDWRRGCHSADDVQRWASFIRRGYAFGKVSGGIQPVNIDYDASDEELIVEIIRRFDEIGDLIDGRLEEGEQEDMLRALALR